MAKGNGIIVSGEPKGRFVEGTMTGTPKPGVWMQLDVSEAPVNGRFSYEVYASGTDGARLPLLILLPDELRGKTVSDAYVSGDRCFMYCPLTGEEMNVLLQDVAGTGDDHSRGELLIGDTGTGKFLATTGSPETEPFQLLETITDPTADTLAWAMCTGF